MEIRFSERVYKKLQLVPKGRVTTYKELAAAIGTTAYRSVGTALKNNPYAPEVPCHRVVASDGSIGGFKGKTQGKEIDEKMMMLEQEGIHIKNNKIGDFDRTLFRFSKSL